MRVEELLLSLPIETVRQDWFPYLQHHVRKIIGSNETPIRFVITEMTKDEIFCELAILKIGRAHV